MSQTNEITEKINKLTKGIELDPQNADLYFQRSMLYLRAKKFPQAIDDCTHLIALDPKNESAYLSRIMCYQITKNYPEAINDCTKVLELHPQNKLYHHMRGVSYENMGRLDKAIGDYTKCIELEPNDVESYEYRKECYTKMGDFDKAIDDLEELFHLDSKYDPVSYHEERESLIEKKNKVEKDQARVDERNKIIADLSHHIKNLISTVIDPLENLQEENRAKPQVIQNALRGANLVHEIVNAMNLSFKGSIEDFFYDAKDNKTKDSTDLRTIIIESLKHSISKMFDGKYFGNFVIKYFPSKDIFLEAKSQWIRISQSDELDELLPFLKKYFFEIELALCGASQLLVGNEKGSTMKFLILFQELILNAVKYSAFVDKEKRFVHIKFTHNAKHISIKVENRFKANVKTRTSGIGHVIIENFAKLLNTKPTFPGNRDIYAVEIQFVNFWEAPTE